MTTQDQIDAYFASLPPTKQLDMLALHQHIRRILPSAKLWFLDGRDEGGKVLSNPNVGYGAYTIRYADGKSREFYQIGISANTSGLSVFVMGLDHRTYLPATYGDSIGKAKVSGYCIKFKALKDIDLAVLEAAIRDGVRQTDAKG